jgi:hypothetical protein
LNKIFVPWQIIKHLFLRVPQSVDTVQPDIMIREANRWVICWPYYSTSGFIKTKSKPAGRDEMVSPVTQFGVYAP